MMKEAAGIEPGFDRFVVRYHANQNGYFVLAIHGVKATYEEDQTFWRILSGTQPINLGVSAYQPADGETVTFELVRHEGGQGAPGRDPCH
ncbi:hypothetical protein C0Q70_10093 [Pomacea canaliculata]|uniref:Transcobalamin-like C-terminal domain-containing protein n=2 Tax=Pomacea canaliculata TaxID=400727 RepID=A0A2T7PBN1_POMCA|nr:hypothetical protein C0Q70_10093 [Pomacea canaliculata]